VKIKAPKSCSASLTYQHGETISKFVLVFLPIGYYLLLKSKSTLFVSPDFASVSQAHPQLVPIFKIVRCCSTIIRYSKMKLKYGIRVILLLAILGVAVGKSGSVMSAMEEFEDFEDLDMEDIGDSGGRTSLPVEKMYEHAATPPAPKTKPKPKETPDIGSYYNPGNGGKVDSFTEYQYPLFKERLAQESAAVDSIETRVYHLAETNIESRFLEIEGEIKNHGSFLKS
jgi:hypothetical protein